MFGVSYSVCLIVKVKYEFTQFIVHFLFVHIVFITTFLVYAHVCKAAQTWLKFKATVLAFLKFPRTFITHNIFSQSKHTMHIAATQTQSHFTKSLAPLAPCPRLHVHRTPKPEMFHLIVQYSIKLYISPSVSPNQFFAYLPPP